MDLDIKLSKATYQVKFTFKKVEASSLEVIGKITCETNTCNFSLEVPLQSFISNDPDLDQHMLGATEAALYPIASASGTFPKTVLTQPVSQIKAIIEFHGVSREYPISLRDNARKASFVLDLDKHKVKRPSLLGIKISNEVKLDFDLKL